MFPVAIVASTILFFTIIFLMYSMIEILSGEKLPSAFSSLKVPAASMIDEAYSFTFSNKTGQDEVTFRHVTDENNTTFASKFGLPTANDSDSRENRKLVTNNNIVISWWDQNLTTDQMMNRTHPHIGVTLGVILLKLPNENIIGAK
jgi:hypothetical protein